MPICDDATDDDRPEGDKTAITSNRIPYDDVDVRETTRDSMSLLNLICLRTSKEIVKQVTNGNLKSLSRLDDVEVTTGCDNMIRLKLFKNGTR